MASSTAYKAHSWRGDHPMKGASSVGSKYFEHEPRNHNGGGSGGGSHHQNIRN